MVDPRKALALALRSNFALWASEKLRGPSRKPYNGKFFVARHHVEWASLVNQYKKLCIIAARDHGKTFAFNFAYPLWMAEKNPGAIGYMFSASAPQAEEKLIHIQREVEQNPKLSHLLPAALRDKKSRRGRLGARWSTKTLEFANGFTLHARGMGTKVRGGHPIFMVCDDILNDETAFSERIRTKEIDYYYNALTPMLDPDGQLIVIGTPFHSADLYGDLDRNSEYVVRKFPAISDWGLPTEAALWPERWPIPALRSRRDEIKPLRFAREYMCEPVVDLASLFPKMLFEGPPVEQFEVELGREREYYAKLGITAAFMGVDFALSSNIGSDYTVAFVLGVDRYGNRWVLDIVRERGLGYEDQLQMITNVAEKYKPGIIFVESNQAQRLYGDILIKHTALPIRHFHTGDEKHSLETGLPGLRILLENRKLRIPRKGDRAREMTDIWIEEMRSHTLTSGKVQSVGEHDDTAMAFWICDQAIRKGSFAFSFEEDEDDERVLEEELALAEAEAEDDPWVFDSVPSERPPVGGNFRDIMGVEDEIDDRVDNPRTKKGNRKPTRPGEDWKPVDRTPTAKEILGMIYGGGWWGR